MNSKKIITLLILVLFAVNLITLGCFWFGRKHGPSSGMPEHGGPAAFLIRELKLTEDQQQQFEKLKRAHHEHIEQVQDSLHELRELFFHELSVSDTRKADSLAKVIGEKQSSIERITFDHFKQVRAICTPEQQKRFDEVIQEALRMMGGPPGGPHGPPPPEK
jgi:protein CpxP